MEGILILQSNMKTVGMILWQKFFLKVSPIVVFNEIYDLPLVPGHLNQWFWCNFDPKFGVFGAVSGVWPGSGQSKKSPLLLKKLFSGKKVTLILHFGLSKPLKQPKTHQILSQNRTKTICSNDLGPIIYHLLKATIRLTLGEKFLSEDHPYC